ncbi:MAG: penicillin-binding protein activator [Candidatus Pacebacteria bacterium]|nr:penicillin-binding protein activator [Candidatus Paceibacterota bacterium]
MSKKIVIWGAVVIVILFILVLIPSKSKNDTIKIGLENFTTGPLAAFGDAIHKAAVLAVDDVNASGGVNGKKLELVEEDYAYDAKQVIPAHDALLSRGAQYILFEGSTAAGQFVGLSKQKNEFFLASYAVSPVYKDGNPLTCRISLTADSYGPTVADYLINRFKTPHIAILVSNNEYGKSVQTAVTKAIEAAGGKVVISETYEQPNGDFRTQLTKIKAAQGLDAFFILNAGNTADGMMKQIKELGITTPLFSEGPTLTNPAVKDFSIFNGVIYSDYPYAQALSDADTPQVKAFKNEFNTRFGTLPTAISAQEYDAIHVLAKAIGESPDKSGAGISNYFIHTLKTYNGIGGQFTFNDDCEVSRSIVMKIMKDGVPQLLK